MKTIRQLFVASVFTFALTVTAFSGEISTPVASPPPPQGITADGEITTGIAGQIETTGRGEENTTDSVTEAVLNLLQNVLSLF